MLTSVWQIPQATSLTRISSARGSSSSTSWSVNGRPAAAATAAWTITGEPYDRARLPLRGRRVDRAGERPDHGGHLSVHGRAHRPRGACRIRRRRPRRARGARGVRRRPVAARDAGRASGGPAPGGRTDRGPRGRVRAADDARGRLADRRRRPAGRRGEAASSTGTPTRPRRTRGRRSAAGVFSSLLVRREPVGVVGAIVPWNFPLGLTMPKLCPALLTGCTVVLKPAEETPLYAFLLAEIFEQAGLPHGVLNVVPADRTVSEELVRHPLVDKISFTGSTRAGSRIGAICGEQIKRCSLELGGKSAAIILDDADLDAVIPALAPATMRNSGQACINQTRVLAPREPLRRGRRGTARRSARSGSATPPTRHGRPADQRGAARARRGLHRLGTRARARGSCSEAAAREHDARLLRRADRLRRRRQRA